MKKIFIALFLISLVFGEEIQVFNSKLVAEKEEEIILKNPALAEIGGFILEEVAKATIYYITIKILEKIGTSISSSLINTSNFKDTYFENGRARWLSNIQDGYVISAYYHSTRSHSATCDGGILGGGKKSITADAGEWAIAFCKAGISRRKTYYNNL